MILIDHCIKINNIARLYRRRNKNYIKRYADVTELTRELCLDIIEYITVDRYSGDKDTPRSIHIYYKFIDKKPIKGE